MAAAVVGVERDGGLGGTGKRVHPGRMLFLQLGALGLVETVELAAISWLLGERYPQGALLAAVFAGACTGFVYGLS